MFIVNTNDLTDDTEASSFILELEHEARRARHAGNFARARMFEAEIHRYETQPKVEVRAPLAVEASVEAFIEEMSEMDAVEAAYQLATFPMGWF